MPRGDELEAEFVATYVGVERHGQLLAQLGEPGSETVQRLTVEREPGLALVVGTSPPRDQATRLPLRGMLTTALRGWEGPASVVLARVDQWEMLTESLGIAVGDEVLGELAARFVWTDGARAMTRFSDDVFGFVCDTMEVEALVAHLREAMVEPLPVYGREMHLTLTMGVAHREADMTVSDTAGNARLALHLATRAGPGAVQTYTAAIRQRLLDRVELEHQLRRAIRNGELVLHYQPIIAVDTMQVVGFEALTRWMHPILGLIPPNDFIPIAEETGLVLPLGNWAIAESCRQLARWRDAGRPTTLSVNLSGRQIADPDLVGTIVSSLDRADLEPDRLSLEITETVLMGDAPSHLDLLSQLKDIGVGLAIDDFGTGYSSLAYLKRFPVDVLKIDRAFIIGLGQGAEDDAIVAAIMALAHALDLLVVAEGVETPVQLAYLRQLACDRVQGYLLGRPAAVPPI